MCFIVLQALFYMYRIFTHTHMYFIDDRLTLHITICSQVSLEVDCVCLLLINEVGLLRLFSFAKQH